MSNSVDPEVLEVLHAACALCMLRADTRQQDADLGDDTEDDCVITEVRPVVPPQKAEQTRPFLTDAPVLETRPPYSFRSLVIQAFLGAPEEQTGMHTFQLADKIIGKYPYFADRRRMLLQRIAATLCISPARDGMFERCEDSEIRWRVTANAREKAIRLGWKINKQTSKHFP